ncbi:hypothetical protein BVRB_020270 [Beta vulgaris subsp. vulgaris]|uniref:Uncharacterized protein n=1 Tax=Beta vulgaris subsp. vulgaris TaxID=3555 RepID=A0A0J8B3Y6_BETVV|nr:hypothetical protein BVRB_020270 [Beta vulgaris subsp. vulgaris]
MVQINDASWITSPSLAVYLPNTILDFGEVIDSSSPALVRLRIRSLLAYPSQLCLVRQPTSQLNLSVQEYNPNIDLEPLYRINTFNVVEVVSQGPFIHLQAQEDREIIVSLYPGGFTGRGTGLQRFNALPFRSTLRLSLDGHVIEIGICARICRSQVVFGTRELLVDCAAGNTDVKTISVHNLSEFATFFLYPFSMAMTIALLSPSLGAVFRFKPCTLSLASPKL